MGNKKRILIAPLDWGLGHATRCIPIANAIEKSGNEVIFASNGRALDLLMKEFPKNKFIKIPSYNIRYSKYGGIGWILNMTLQIPKIISIINKENKALQNIIDDFKIDGVISDNRFGMYSKKIPSVFITHQINIKSPYFEKFIRNLNINYISKFDECWIPDNNNRQLSGDLSIVKNKKITTKFIGPLSRFKKVEKKESLNILGIISGPEPQRTIFQNILVKQLKNKNAVLVLGKPEANKSEKIGDLKLISHLNTKELNQLIIDADIIISRSGYSTVMDLAVLDKNAIFIPTPGQTEQLYLAEYYYKNEIAFAMHQHEFDIEIALKKHQNFKGFKNLKNNIKLEELLTIFEE